MTLHATVGVESATIAKKEGSIMNRFSKVSLLLAASVVFPVQQTRGQDAFAVGTAKASPGQKVSGTIEVPAGSDAALSIPLVVARGARPGPVLALVSGAHGTEYASILAMERVIAMLDPSILSGTVIVVPLINIPSFEQKIAHINPVDRKSMNRFYPGRIDGTQTERAAYLITKEVVDRCDYLIDFHGGDLDESLRPYGYWIVSGNAQLDAASREMLLAFGVDHIIISTDRPKDAAASRYLDATATLRGKPSAAIEAGYAGTTETDDIEFLVSGSFNVMRHLKMLPGTVTPIENPVWVETLATVTSDQNGIFYPLVRRGTYVAQGMKVGYVTDYVGKTLLEARAPASGIVMFVRAVPSMTKGETIAVIGVVAKQPPN
jgi:predicted deacylase